MVEESALNCEYVAARHSAGDKMADIAREHGVSSDSVKRMISKYYAENVVPATMDSLMHGPIGDEESVYKIKDAVEKGGALVVKMLTCDIITMKYNVGGPHRPRRSKGEAFYASYVEHFDQHRLDEMIRNIAALDERHVWGHQWKIIANRVAKAPIDDIVDLLMWYHAEYRKTIAQYAINLYCAHDLKDGVSDKLVLPINKFRMSNGTSNALEYGEFRSHADLFFTTDSQMLMHRGIGEVALKEIREYCSKVGLTEPSKKTVEKRTSEHVIAEKARNMTPEEAIGKLKSMRSRAFKALCFPSECAALDMAIETMEKVRQGAYAEA